MDVDGIPFGADFVKRLTAEVTSCDMLVAVIGPKWLDIRDDDGNRRIENSTDFVRVEIAAALQRDIPVIPILLEGTRIPRADRLPPDLKDLSVREGLEIRHTSFHSDVNRLVLQLRGMPSNVDDGRDTADVSFQHPNARPQRFFASVASPASLPTDGSTATGIRGALSARKPVSALTYGIGFCSILALIAVAALPFKWPCQWVALFGGSNCRIEPVYQNYSSAELG